MVAGGGGGDPESLPANGSSASLAGSSAVPLASLSVLSAGAGTLDVNEQQVFQALLRLVDTTPI